METTELIGTIIVLLALAVLTAQVAYDFGRRHGVKAERLLANRRVNGVMGLAELECKRKPKSQKAKRQRARKAARYAAGSVALVTLFGGLS
jgi:hypothetical protein